MDHHKALVQRGDRFRGKWVGGVHRRHALKVDVGAGKLRGDEVDVIFHRSDDGVHHRLPGVAALAGVANEFLDPLEINDRHDPDQQVDMAGDIMLRRDNPAVQPLIEQHVRRLRQRLPRGEGSRHLIPRHGFVIGVEVFTRLTFAMAAIVDKGLFQQTEVVRLRAKVADMFALIPRFADRHVHFRAGVAMKAVAFHLRSVQI